jgi:hypothetical protein
LGSSGDAEDYVDVLMAHISTRKWQCTCHVPEQEWVQTLCTALQTKKWSKTDISGEDLREILKGFPEFRNIVTQNEVMHNLCAKNRFLPVL